MSTPSRWRTLAALAVLCGACQHRDPPPKTAAASSDDPQDEGERRADMVGATRLGTPGPVLTLKTIDGQTIDLAQLYGKKPVYLKFWATWCIPCRAQMPGFERTYETLGDQIEVISVNAGLDDDEASVRAFRDRFGLHMPTVVDNGELAAALDLRVTPQHILIGRDARIAYVGHLDGDRLQKAIQKVLAAPAPDVPAAGQTTAPRAAFRPGDLVDGLAAKTTDGTQVQIGPSRDGRPRAVVLFLPWCESYDGFKNNQPQTPAACRRIREQLGPLVARGDVDWLGIAGGPWTDADEVTEYKTTMKTKFPLVFDADGAQFRAFGVHRTPTIALLDPSGRLVRLLGPDDHDLAEAVQALAGRR
jgi:thiol-disulfide isomerase/thioredoxin